MVAVHQGRKSSSPVGGGGSAHPSEYIVPYLPRERATGDDVLHGLLGLVAQGTMIIVRQTKPSESSGGPAAIEVGEPSEDFDSQGAPSFPCQAPEGGRGGASVQGQVARLGRVGVVRRPPQVMRLGTEVRVIT